MSIGQGLGAYRINGVECTKENGLLPSKHSISFTAPTEKDTVGGTVLIDPPGGIKRMHTWSYADVRFSTTISQLFTVLGVSRIAIISTPNINTDQNGNLLWLEGVKVTVKLPDFESDGARDKVASFNLVFTELASYA